MPVNSSIYAWPAVLPLPTTSVEEARRNPMTLLRGVAADGFRSQQLSINDQTLFARSDGSQLLTIPDPPNFASPSPEEFMNWHSYFQQKYLFFHGNTYPVTDGGDTFTVRYASIGGNADPFLNVNVVLSQDGKRLIRLDTLQLNELAAMELREQRALAGLPLFHSVYAAPLGVIPNSTVTDATAVRNAIIADIDVLVSSIQNTSDYVAGQGTLFETDPNSRLDLYHYISIGQLDVLKARLDRMAIFSPEVIKAEYKDIYERFQRINNFVLATRSNSNVSSGLAAGLNALDDLQSLDAAEKVLKSSELKLFEKAGLAFDVAQTGVYTNEKLGITTPRKLDAPNLVFVLQTLASEAAEAEADGLVEEMNQVNRLLSDYTALQKILNETLKKYDPVGLADPDNIEKLGIKGETGAFAGNTAFSAADRKAIAMFDVLAAPASGNTFHPMENKNNVTRPTESIVDTAGNLVEHSKDIWDKLAIKVSEATKILNQDSQVRMDQIQRMNQQKNRSYDLATGTLTRLADILRSIIN